MYICKIALQLSVRLFFIGMLLLNILASADNYQNRLKNSWLFQ